jgi:hypothetical protein
VDLKTLEQETILRDQEGLQVLCLSEERLSAQSSMGNQAKSNAIDKCHRMMHLWKQGNRNGVMELIGRFAPFAEHELWRVMNALYEVLPNGSEDHVQAGGILSSLDSLLRESKQLAQQATKPQLEQGTLEL